MSEVKRVHDCIIGSGLEQKKLLGNLLLQVYGNCGALEDTHAFFAKMQERDLFSWNCVIKAYARNGRGKEALELFEQMYLEELTADRFIFISLLYVCGTPTALSKGKYMHSCIVNCGLESDIVLATALVNMYGKCGSMDNAWGIFDKMLEHDAVSWTTMIAVFVQNGETSNALGLFLPDAA